MKNRFLKASRIHDGRRFLPEGCVLEVDASGTVAGIHDKNFTEEAEHFEGILCPGFVNVHCHLELSHMKGMIPEGTGLIPFLQAVTKERISFTDEQKKAARHEGYAELWQNGIVAVGDIANTTDTLDLRALNELHVHTFIECIGFTETHADARLEYSLEIDKHFEKQTSDTVLLRQSVVPHAPYSASPVLFGLINGVEEHSIISIHNQEGAAEDEYYRSKTGAVCDLLRGFGIDDSFFVASGKSSLQTYLPSMGDSHPLILVHNTYSGTDDVRFAENRSGTVFWCLCPGANMYIEGRLPDVSMLQKETDNICIGTDSLASNHQLSVLAELLLLKSNFPELEWEDLLRWATYSGAKALHMDDVIGSFETGQKPGIVQLSSTDDSAIVQRII